jgi:rhodanese-related sulfurtransferase
VVFCAGGYRSAIASSLLRSHGFSDVSDLLGGYTAWSTGNIPAALPVIDVDAASVDADAFFLDVREDDEWEAGHAPAAQHVAMRDLPDHLDEFNNGRRVVVICRSGNRSGKVTAWLLNHGIDAVNMTGGMQVWQKSGLPVVNAEGATGTVI